MSPTLTPTQPSTTLNGLDTLKMVETVSAWKANPALAKFEFRARNRWISGGENRSTIKDFYGAGAEDVGDEGETTTAGPTGGPCHWPSASKSDPAVSDLNRSSGRTT